MKISNLRKMLSYLIQTNMSKVTGSDSYKLENSKTYFTFESTLRVDPLLITLPIFADIMMLMTVPAQTGVHIK